MTCPLRRARRVLLTSVLCAMPLLAGACRANPPGEHWPLAPTATWQRGGDEYRAFDLNGDGRFEYLQRRRAGYTDQLHFIDRDTGQIATTIRRPAAPGSPVTLLLLLDGVAFERMQTLHAAGHFGLFRPPVRLITTFPTLTDPVFDRFFGTGPTPGYEAGYFDRAANRLTDAYGVYLRGENELWLPHVDYRLNLLHDAFMYLYPRPVFRSELRRARAALDRVLAEGRGDPALYLLTTDALGHLLPQERLDAELRELDGWIERIVHDYRGRIEIVALADHGMSAVPCELFDMRGVLAAAGLRLRERLWNPGDVAVPIFGLLDVARVHTYDAATRDRVVAALRDRPEVELLAFRDGERIVVITAAGQAWIDAEQRDGVWHYRYTPQPDDALEWGATLAAMRAAGALDAAGFAPADVWFAHTADADFPDAVVRLWDGVRLNSHEQPDVVVSLGPGWFCGSKFLARFVTMLGTHGGLHRRATETFAMTTTADLPDPLSLDALRALLRDRFGMTLGTISPAPTP